MLLMRFAMEEISQEEGVNRLSSSFTNFVLACSVAVEQTRAESLWVVMPNCS